MNEKQLIEKIHGEFDSAEDRLLNEAHSILSSQNTSVIGVSERLKAVGFINTPTAKKGSDANQKLVNSKQEAELIEYYKTAYPFLKFLTERELERICAKYGLTHSFVSNYIKEIPESNLTDIERCQPLRHTDQPSDVIYAKINYHAYILPGSFLSIWNKQFWTMPRVIEGKHFSGWSDCDSFLERKFNIKNDIYITSSVKNFTVDKQGLFICAPPSHFKNKSKFNISFTEVKDPIVFRYVRGGVQVITKWGLEANDPSLVVPVLN